jgi:hypothetical protein
MSFPGHCPYFLRTQDNVIVLAFRLPAALQMVRPLFKILCSGDCLLTAPRAVSPGAINVKLFHEFDSTEVRRVRPLAEAPTVIPTSREQGIIHTKLTVSGRPRSFE